MKGNFPPSPFDPLPQLPLYTDGTPGDYWFDDRDFDVHAYLAQVSAEANTSRSGGMAKDDAPALPGDGGGSTNSSGGGSSSYGESSPTNGLWLQITGITNRIVSLNLNNATDTVYEVWTKTDLTQTNWNIEQEVFPTNQEVMPFTIAEQGRANLMVWARDWTGITSNGNETPEWWFYEYFGTVDLSDTNLDVNGNTLLYDYQNGIDPNIINGLWLQITGITNGTISLALNNATDMVYEVWSATSLSNPVSWNIEQAVWPVTNQTLTPFTVEVQERTNSLFFWARDWTGITSNGNLTPEWWFWENFGTVDLSDTNLDAQGRTLLYDYTNNINPNPNVIYFAVNVTNQDFNTSSATVQITVSGGVPYYMAALVDSTAYSNANWTPFNSNLVVNLGSVEGWHTISVGLKGFPPDAQQTWDPIQLKLVLTPPVLIITNPIVGTVTQPVIQLQGYCSENLASMSYDLSNSASFETNQQAFVTTRQFETNNLEYTTNGFECFNIPLADGTNTVTLYATDSAGNVTITNLVYILDPAASTNPPVINLSWPQNNAFISGTTFPVRGIANDPFATVSAQVVNGGGTSNLTGLVEQNGSFWIENMPLGSGTNYLTITATNTAGYGSATNIVVVQSPITLIISSVSFNDPMSPTATVNGTLAGSSDIVLVNGVQATNSGDGTWTAYYVPVGDSGTASIVAQAMAGGMSSGDGTGFMAAAPNSSPEPDAQIAEDIVRGPEIAMVNCDWNGSSEYNGPCTCFVYNASYLGYYSHIFNDPMHWSYGSAGYNLYSDCLTYYGFNPDVVAADSENDTVALDSSSYNYNKTTWGATGNGSTVSLTTNVCGATDGATSLGPAASTFLPGFQEIAHWQYSNPSYHLVNWQYLDQQRYVLKTGGQAIPGQQNLWVIHATANDESIGDIDGSGPAIPPSQITAAGQTLDANGNVYLRLPNNSPPVDVTPMAPGNAYTFSGPTATEYTLVHQTECTAWDNSDNERTTIGIGEIVDLSGMPGNTTWSVSGGGSLSHTSGGSTTFTASVSPGASTVTAQVGSEQLSVPFKVIAPSGSIVAPNPSQGLLGHSGTNEIGQSSMYTVYIAPTTVSFFNVQFRESSGSFTNNFKWPNGTNGILPDLNSDLSVDCDNEYADLIADGLYPKSYIDNGINYIDFSYTTKWVLQYQNNSGTWVTFTTNTTVTEFSGTSLQTCVTYNGVPGYCPQGPFQ